MHPIRRRAALALLLATLPPALAACDDGPTAPTSYAHVVGGRTWVAVAAPDGLVDAKTWAPYVAHTGMAYRRLQVLAKAEVDARRAGELERAQALEEEQARVAAAASHPGMEPILRSGAALDRWDERVRSRLSSGAYPGLDSARVQVARMRARSRLFLSMGDTAGAASALTDASVIARSWTPRAVGLRVLADVNARLDAAGARSPGLRRARDLLRDAREALATGDEARAVKRAAYAVEIIDAELRAAPGPRPPAG
jgi:hypothetical protein